MIYLDAAATSFLKPSCVAQAVVNAIRARNPQAAYDAMWQHLVDNKRSIESIPDDA